MVLFKQRLGKFQEFDFGKPAYTGPPQPIITWQGIVDTLNNQLHFRVPWQMLPTLLVSLESIPIETDDLTGCPHTFQLTQHDYLLSRDTPANTRRRVLVKECLCSPKDGLDQVRRLYEATTAKLIRQHNHKIGDMYQVDIETLRMRRSSVASLPIPLKSNGGPDIYTEHSLSDVFAHQFSYVFLDLNTAQPSKIRAVYARETKRLGEVMQKVVTDIKARHVPSLRQMFNMESVDMTLSSYGARLVEDFSMEDVASMILSGQSSQLLLLHPLRRRKGWAQMIDRYLSDKYYSTLDCDQGACLV
ncbi:hypothetical protein DL763_009417 [Monosporascus cannonballus]|nr:hypothetical protein DL763_009417 [Monosporascus cannonballus]